MTHKPAVGIGGFGRNNTSELIDRSPYIASAAPSSSPTSKAAPPPPPLRRLAAELHSLGERPPFEAEITVFEKSGGPLTKRITLRDSSACRMANGFARRVRIDNVQAAP